MTKTQYFLSTLLHIKPASSHFSLFPFLHGILLAPFSGSSFISRFIGLVDMGDFGNKWIIGVGVSQQRADGQQNLGDGQGGTPLILQDIQADASVGIYVGVIDSGDEVDLGGLERIVGGEMNVQEEDTSGIRTVIRSHDGGLPMELVLLVLRASRAVCGWVSAEVDKFFLDALKSHGIL